MKNPLQSKNMENLRNDVIKVLKEYVDEDLKGAKGVFNEFGEYELTPTNEFVGAVEKLVATHGGNTFVEYQQKAMTTCTPSSENILYMLFNLQGEVGELSSKIAKLIRKGKMKVDSTLDGHTHEIDATEEEMQAIAYECGDVLWQLSGVCSVLGFSLADVANANLEKLASRKSRGVIVGNGDNR